MQSSQPGQSHPVPPQTVPVDQNTKSVQEGEATHASAVATAAAENDPKKVMMLLQMFMVGLWMRCRKDVTTARERSPQTPKKSSYIL